MTTSSRHRSAARWPFWLLLAAWVCANSPQAATYALLAWLGEARHFSHQQRLTAEVASLLAGERAPGPGVAMTDAPAKPPAPPLPAEAVLKKLDLAVERTVGPQFRQAAGKICGASGWTMPDPRRAPPPHEPPRARFQS